MFTPLNLPPAPLKIKEMEGKFKVYDVFRKKDILLTPEEWVRQHILHYLISHLNYPQSLISVEREIIYHALKKRFDILIYSKQAQPFLLIECKAPEVVLTNDSAMQIVRYNDVLNAPWIVISNGIQHLVFEKIHETFEIRNEIPNWNSIKK